jgi:transcriptional regulator with GAF, ATPase, and Fis domain
MSTTDRDALLARRLVSLADTLVDEYDVVDLLDQLVHTIVELLPVDQAGLLLIDERGEPQLVASTSESTRLLELYQLQSREGGPCLACIASGSQVSVGDLAQDDRWPSFGGHARAVGFGAVHAFPLRLRTEVLGALNLFSAGDPALNDLDVQVAQALGDMATIGILQQRTAQRASLVAEQLQSALDTRVVIEQAKGVLAEAGQVEMQVAFESLRDYARGGNLKLGSVAEDLVRRRLHPDEVLAARRTSP